MGAKQRQQWVDSWRTHSPGAIVYETTATKQISNVPQGRSPSALTNLAHNVSPSTSSNKKDNAAAFTAQDWGNSPARGYDSSSRSAEVVRNLSIRKPAIEPLPIGEAQASSSRQSSPNGTPGDGQHQANQHQTGARKRSHDNNGLKFRDSSSGTLDTRAPEGRESPARALGAKLDSGWTEDLQPKLKLLPSLHHAQDWNETRPKKMKKDAESAPDDSPDEAELVNMAGPETGSLLTRWIKNWRSRVQPYPLAVDQEMDPYPSIFDFPESFMDTTHGDVRLQHNQLAMTAQVTIDIRMGRVDKKKAPETYARDKSGKKQLVSDTKPLAAKTTEVTKPLVSNHKKITIPPTQTATETMTQSIQDAFDGVTPDAESVPFKCRREAHFRQACEEDLQAIANIYHKEVTDGWCTLDTRSAKTNTVESWQAVLDHCREYKLPFLVAVTGYLYPGREQYSRIHRVIGFAFLDFACRGLGGRIETTAQQTGRLQVIVERPYRNMRVGTALLDIIMTTVSPAHEHKRRAYQFTDSNSPIYFLPKDNSRKWRLIHLEVLIQDLGSKKETVKGAEYQFFQHWLEKEFNFKVAMHSRCFAQCTDSAAKWLDRVIFEHVCVE